MSFSKLLFMYCISSKSIDIGWQLLCLLLCDLCCKFVTISRKLLVFFYYFTFLRLIDNCGLWICHNIRAAIYLLQYTCGHTPVTINMRPYTAEHRAISLLAWGDAAPSVLQSAIHKWLLLIFPKSLTICRFLVPATHSGIVTCISLISALDVGSSAFELR